jgi:hypothetical protein
LWDGADSLHSERAAFTLKGRRSLALGVFACLCSPARVAELVGAFQSPGLRAGDFLPI